jgi:carbamate kinase
MLIGIRWSGKYLYNMVYVQSSQRRRSSQSKFDNGSKHYIFMSHLMPLTNFMYFNSHGNGPAVGSMSKKPSKAENRREQRMKIREVEIESIQNELKKPSAEVIQLKKDRKATNHQTATLKYACDLEARTQVHRILEILYDSYNC